VAPGCRSAGQVRRRDLELVLRIVLGVRQAATQCEDKKLVDVHRERLLDFKNSYRWDSVDRQFARGEEAKFFEKTRLLAYTLASHSKCYPPIPFQANLSRSVC
jgi:hypothetical protein